MKYLIKVIDETGNIIKEYSEEGSEQCPICKGEMEKLNTLSDLFLYKKYYIQDKFKAYKCSSCGYKLHYSLDKERSQICYLAEETA